MNFFLTKKLGKYPPSSYFTGRDLQKRAFRDHSELSLLTEVLSWRRTFREETTALGLKLSNVSPPTARRQTRVSPPPAWQATRVPLSTWLLILLLAVRGAGGSESPERECCENPAYNFQEAGRATPSSPPAAHTYSPPEEPDMPPEVPELPGLNQSIGYQ